MKWRTLSPWLAVTFFVGFVSIPSILMLAILYFVGAI